MSSPVIFDFDETELATFYPPASEERAPTRRDASGEIWSTAQREASPLRSL